MVFFTPGPTIRLRIKCHFDHYQNPIQILHHLIISEPQYPISSCPDHISITHGIDPRIMGHTIDFNHQAFRGTEKIDNSVADYGLSAELKTIEAAGAQLHPQPPLRLGQFAAHYGRAFEHDCACGATTPNPLL